jgi:predicted dehydrogenase
VEVVAVSARRLERAQETAARFGIPHALTDFDEMLKLDGLDAVSIATPPALHREMTLAALRAGKHVLCEKPFAVSEAEALEMYQAARASGLTAVVAHEFRYSSGRSYAAELIRDGYIGELRFCTMRLLLGGPPPGAPQRPAPTGPGAGFLFALGSHYIDCLRAWFGEVESVSGDVTNAAQSMTLDAVLDDFADDTFSFTLNFVDGGFAHMIASRSAALGSGPAVEVYGSEGTLVLPQTGVNPPSHGTVLGAKKGEEKLRELAVPERLQPFQDERDDRLMPFRLQVRDFLAGIEGGNSPAPSFYDGWRNQQVLDAVRESARTGRRVTIANP